MTIDYKSITETIAQANLVSVIDLEFLRWDFSSQ
jgi:hypothetical protein